MEDEGSTSARKSIYVWPVKAQAAQDDPTVHDLLWAWSLSDR